jgi:phosphatidyl-myo-inositol dimannoside synthase
MAFNKQSIKDKVLFFTFDFPPLDGGISRLCSEIAIGLASREVDVHVLSFAGTEKVFENKLSNLRLETVTSRRPFRELIALQRLFILKKSYDIILCDIWYPEGLLAVIAGFKKIIVLAHGTELMANSSGIAGYCRSLLMRWVLTKAHCVVANSSFTAGLVKKAAPGADTTALPLAVDVKRFSPMSKDDSKARYGVSGKTVVSSVSRLYRFKGHETVFRAIAMLAETEKNNLSYLIAGKGPDESYLHERAEKSGIAHLVHWLGYVPENELHFLYNASDLYVLCTVEDKKGLVEGFGLTFLEAQACGVPVLGTRSGGIPDAVKESSGGVLINENDYTALSAVFSDLSAHPEKYRDMGQKARKRVETECTWTRYIDNMISILNG